MIKIGLFLGVAPESGGAFQYAESVLQALTVLDRNTLTLVLAVAHPAWEQVAEAADASGGVMHMRESIPDRMFRLAVRAGLPSRVVRTISSHAPGISRNLAWTDCDSWIFPAQEHYAFCSRINSIGTIHDLMHRHERRFPEVSYWGLYWQRENHYRAMCKHAKAILTDSVVGKQHVIDAYEVKQENIYVLPYCPPPQRQIDVEEERRLLAELGLEGRQFFFYPAQFWEHKNHIRLIDAFSAVKQRYPEIYLLLTGARKNGSDAVDRIIKALNLHQAIIMPGYIHEAYIQALYKYATALVMPTFFGPTNIPPLDAMRAGCPMALSDVYAMREQSGDAAIYFDPKDTQSIADAMLRILSEPELAGRLRRAGPERLIELNLAAFVRRLSVVISNISAP